MRSGTLGNSKGRRAYARNRMTPRCERLEERRLLSSVYYSPAQIRHAYGFDRVTFSSAGKAVAGDGNGQTIAIVDAYYDPYLFKSHKDNTGKTVPGDLQQFDAKFGLSNNDGAGKPVLTQYASTSAPTVDFGWGIETALDVEWAHALAPKAHILLVEAGSSGTPDLLGAANYARNQPGVSAVSMSWGGGEFSNEHQYDGYFSTPAGHNPVTFVAATGDNGGQVAWPAAATNVVAVGGTTLALDKSGNYASEKGWSGSGGGTSAYEPLPSYQASTVGKTTHRRNPDLAFNADPNSGFIVYDTDPSDLSGSLYSAGGTSGGTPAIAAMIAIADEGRALQGKGTLDGLGGTLPALYKAGSADYHDITSGSNGFPAIAGYDLVTGRGTPYADRLIADLVKAPSSNVGISGATPGLPNTKFTARVIATRLHVHAHGLHAMHSLAPLLG